MGTLTAFKLEFKSPLHIGTVRADYDSSDSIQHSDTLYAAILSAFFKLGLENRIEEIIDPANGALRDITLSSLYPYCSPGKESLYFLPIPLGSVEPAETSGAKKLRKAKFVDQDYFQRIQREGKIRVPEQGEPQEFLTLNEEFDPGFIRRQVFPRVRVPRSSQTSDTQIFYIERIFFKQGAGLFGLALVENETAKKRLFRLLEFLGDEGIGTDRNVGHGFFEVKEADDFDWLFQVDSPYQTNLSLFLPEDKDQLNQMLTAKSRYQLIKRGGWITSPTYLTYRKQSIHMFMEGGIFQCSDQVAGRTVNLKPEDEQLPAGKTVDMPVYRSGKSLFVPIQIK